MIHRCLNTLGGYCKGVPKAVYKTVEVATNDTKTGFYKKPIDACELDQATCHKYLVEPFSKEKLAILGTDTYKHEEAL